MNLQSFVQYVVVPSGLVSLGINVSFGIFVYLQNRRSALNRFFAIFALSIGCWSVGSSLENMISDPTLALRALRLCYVSAAFLPTFFLHFTFVLTHQSRSKRPYLSCSYLTSGVFALLAVTDSFVRGLRIMEPYGFRISDPGPVYIFFFVFFAICLSSGLWLMYQNIRSTTGGQQRQMQYIFLSHLIALAAGIEYFTRVFRLISFPPMDDYILVVYFLVFGYAIIRHQLMEIHVILRKTMVYSLVAASLAGLYLGMMYMIGLPLKYYAYSGLVNAVACAGIGIYVLIKQKNSAVGKLFSYLTLLISFWSLFYFLWLRVETNRVQADVLVRTCMIAVVLMPPAFMHLSLLLSQQAHPRWHITFQYLFSAALATTVYSPWFARGLEPFLIFPFWPHPGPSFTLHVIQMMVLVNWGLYLLWRAGSQSEGRRYVQLRWTFWGYLIGWYSGFANYLVWFRVPVPPILNAFVSFYVFAIAYAIVKHQLLDIRIVLRKSLLYSVLIAGITGLYLVMILIMEHWFAGFFGYRSLVATAMVAFLIAISFNPLRDYLQAWLDRALFSGTTAELAAQREQLLEQVRKGDQMKAVATLAAGLAHEIKNPLASIKTFTEYLDNHYTDPEFRKKFKRIVGGEVERINLIVQQLLEFAKPVPPKLMPLEVAQVVDDTLEFLGGEFVKRQVAVGKRYDTRGQILGDPQQLKQVFLNLFLNSLDAMNGHGKLDVQTAVEGSDLVVSIADNGSGIAPKDCRTSSSPFIQPRPTAPAWASQSCTASSKNTAVGL